jgi:hypothetical protein
MADTGDGGIPNPNPPAPVMSYVVDALRRRLESVPYQFLYAAGLTNAEINKIKTGTPITWEEYTMLNFKVGHAESLYRQWTTSVGQSTPGTPGESGGGPRESSSIPTWMILMLGMLMVLVVIVILLRRT